MERLFGVIEGDILGGNKQHSRSMNVILLAIGLVALAAVCVFLAQQAGCFRGEGTWKTQYSNCSDANSELREDLAETEQEVEDCESEYQSLKASSVSLEHNLTELEDEYQEKVTELSTVMGRA